MALEERMARVEGILEQMDKRLNHLESDLGELREEVRSGLSGLRAEFREDLGELRGRFWWLMGIQISMWVTIILAIILT